MKRKAASILVTGLIVASLAGCGTKTEATEQTPENNASVVETETEAEVETETNTEDVSDETMSTEVIGNDTEENINANDNGDIPTIDYGYLVIYDKVFKPEVEINRESFHVLNTPESYTFNQDTNVYGTNGELVGYVKAGSEVTFNNRNDDWIRFNHNVEGLTYPYLMVQAKDLEANTDEDIKEVYKLSPERVTEIIIEKLEAREEAPTILSAPDSDMQSIEFSLWNQYDELRTMEDISKALYSEEMNLGDFTVAEYSTFYVECTGNEEKVDCVLYYKDKIEEQ